MSEHTPKLLFYVAVEVSMTLPQGIGPRDTSRGSYLSRRMPYRNEGQWWRVYVITS
ncbi:hypothetical protein BV25DRAFT_1825683 [Artomyces pyxidatus]|uniref:Uncharacterized protein n=1 Tax=Artomyces pyxidatus TaxID=48021 RepID=A0ACB8T0Q6_9AGAM|nr:hypothetical protein BV25DRAFT_1825683 [Artomyces pyxidatus]